MVAMVRMIIGAFSILVLVGCDHFPGPSIRNEFPTDVNVKIQYSDGTSYAATWPRCRMLSAGAAEIGRFGMQEKNVSVDEIIVESGGKTVQRLDKAAIADLMERGEKEGHPYWIFAQDGIKFSYARECSQETATPPGE